jgi:hypothetical protein
MADVVAGHKRPKCRSECRDGPRPCPWVGCRYHLFLNVNFRGRLCLKWGRDVEEAFKKMPDTCALDVADRGIPHEDRATLKWCEIGEYFNMTHYGVLLHSQVALRNIRELLEGREIKL